MFNLTGRSKEISMTTSVPKTSGVSTEGSNLGKLPGIENAGFRPEDARKNLSLELTQTSRV